MSDRPDSPTPEVLHGLLYAHTRANLNTIEAHQALANVQALIELLVASGAIDPDQFAAYREAAEARLREEFVQKGMSVAIQEHPVGKYELEEEAEIDCASRVHLCGAACCRLSFALSKEDVEEGVVRWELGRPYMIAQTADRRCVHLDRSSHGCTVYEARPVPCRQYDCRTDKRVWLDFEGKVPNPRLGDPDWPFGESEVEDETTSQAPNPGTPARCPRTP